MHFSSLFRSTALTLLFGSLAVATPLAAQPQTQSEVTLLPMTPSGVSASQLFNLLAEDLHPIAGGVAAFTRGVGGPDIIRIPKSSLDQLVTDHPNVFSYVQTGQQITHLAVDNAALAETLADSKSTLRGYLSGVSKLPLASFEKIDATWKNVTGRPQRVVVVMAGLQSAEDSAELMGLQIFKQTNIPACVFAYPNDGPIAASGELLAAELRELHREYPTTKLTLVTHSMGGLVSRAAIEMEPGANEIEALGVDQLIQVCPPNHGSALAEYGTILELAEQAYRLFNRPRNNERRKLLRAIVDGFGEASIDLAPGSAFLTQLNDCPRNPRVRYSIIAGNAGPFRGRVTSLLGSVWERVSANVAEPEELDRRVTDLLKCEEFIEGKGDGVVTITSAQLQGVEDFSLLNINHMVWYHLDAADGKQMLNAVCGRLGISL